MGETVVMKWRNIPNSIQLVAAAACLWASACGGGNKANQVVVTVSPGGGTLVVTQSVTLTAIVTGATDVSSTGPLESLATFRTPARL